MWVCVFSFVKHAQVFLTVGGKEGGTADKYLVTAFPTKNAIDATCVEMWKILAWSFRCLFIGVHPTQRLEYSWGKPVQPNPCKPIACAGMMEQLGLEQIMDKLCTKVISQV